MNESRTLEFKQEISRSFLKQYRHFLIIMVEQLCLELRVMVFFRIENPTLKCLDIENLINANIDELPDYSLQANYKTNVISLIVLEGLYKPYFNKCKSYTRNDTSTIEIDRLELTKLVLEGRKS